MLISLGLNVLVFPQPLDDRPQLLLMRMSEGVLRFLRLGFSHVTEGIVESMELVVEIIQRVVDPLAAPGLGGGVLHHVREIDHHFDARGAFSWAAYSPARG